MVRKGIILSVVLLFPFLCEAQFFSREKRAEGLIRKQKYHSAFVLLKKVLARDSSNVKARYVLARYFMQPANADYQLDSAYAYAGAALGFWEASSSDQQRKLQRFPVNEKMIRELRREIEDMAFAAARTTATEDALNGFLRRFPTPRLQEAAVSLRDELGYADARAANTATAYLEYLKKYPQSRFAPEAKTRYDNLIFQEATRDKNLESYAAFLRAFPDSPYRRQVDQHIYEIVTADGSFASFIAFLDQYPNSYFRRRAIDILYHISIEDRRNDSTSHYLQSDSLRHIAQLRDEFLVPFLSSGKFGLMNPYGKVVVDARLAAIDDEYLCGNVSEDLVVLSDQVITQAGDTLFTGTVTAMDDLGYGFLLVERSSGKSVVHKSGFIFPETGIADARVIAGSFVALEKNGLWGLFTFNGRKLLDYECRSIDAIGSVVVMKLQERFTLSTVRSLAAIANNQKGRFTEAFDDVKKILSDKIWIRLGEFEGILDQQLEILVKMDRHQLTPVFFGVLAASPKGVSTFNTFGEESEIFQRVHVVNPWVAARNASGWIVFDPLLRIPRSIPYDSVVVQGPFAVGVKNDSLAIHFHRHREERLLLPPHERIELLSAHDSIAHLALFRDKKWTVYDARGKKLFTAGYDRIQSAGDGFFIVSIREKKGLVDASGKLVLPIDYDAIGSFVNGSVSLLRGMKFGLFDHVKRRLIKPEYEKNIVTFNDTYYAVFRGGLWGFVNGSNKLSGKMEFLEVMPWTDSVALVKSGSSWQLFDVFRAAPVMQNIKSFSTVRQSRAERLLIMQQDSEVGVISSRDGIVIPFSFSDIVNVGSPEVPVYFTEKHVSEASLFVVIYYDAAGRLIRREVYEQDDYERIYCNRRK